MGLADALAPNIANGLRPWRYGAPASASIGITSPTYVAPVAATRVTTTTNSMLLSLTGPGQLLVCALTLSGATATNTATLDGAQWLSLNAVALPTWYLFVGRLATQQLDRISLPLRFMASLTIGVSSISGGGSVTIDYDWAPDF